MNDTLGFNTDSEFCEIAKQWRTIADKARVAMDEACVKNDLKEAMYCLGMAHGLERAFKDLCTVANDVDGRPEK